MLEDPAGLAGGWLGRVASEGGHLALAGGSTVGRAYVAAAELLPEWAGAHVWFGDERAVPPGDDRSNYRLVHATRCSTASASPPEVHRIRGELGAEQAAELYDRELEGVTLDLALNGIGADGHTASLFPDAPALEERERRAVAAEPGAGAVRRAGDADTARVRGDAAARSTSSPASRRRRRCAGPSPTSRAPRRPASLIRGVETIAILDAAAASRLPQG